MTENNMNENVKVNAEAENAEIKNNKSVKDKSELKIDAQIQVTAKQLYQFNLYHCYRNTSSGMFGIIMGILCALYAFIASSKLGTTNTIIVALLAVMFIVYNPIALYIRSKNRFLNNDALKKPMNYCFDEQGFILSQGEQSEDMEWEDLYKVVEHKDCFYFFFTRIHANIVPKEGLGGNLDEIIALINKNVKGKKNKLKKEHKAC